MFHKNKPTVIIENEVFQKIMFWVNKSNYEVSGLGVLRVEDDGVLRVVDAMLLPQKNGPTHTDIEPEHVGKLMFQMKDTPGELRFWWHSHVDMPVFWSGTDLDTIEKLGMGGWFLSTVFNKKREMKSCFYAVQGSNTPWGTEELFLDDLTTTVPAFVHARQAEWEEQYTTNVTNQASFWAGKDASYSSGWVRQDDGSYAPADNAFDDDYDSVPPKGAGEIGKKPPGISKKQWKRIQRSRRETSSVPALKPPGVQQRLGLIEQDAACDEYGFTKEERGMFALEGWDESDLDELVDLDFTPAEIYELMVNDVSPEEVIDMISAGWTTVGVMKHLVNSDDVPVMDRKGT
jgi:hypothetical protein